MATVTALSTKGGGGGKASLEYICRDDKTDYKRLVYVGNCTLQTAYDEFRNTKQLYNKTGGIQYYHFVQSHPKGYEISPESALKIASEFADRELRELSDEICMKYGVATLDKPDLKRRTNGITTGEYRSAMKQQSWKMDLMNTIDIVMRCAVGNTLATVIW